MYAVALATLMLATGPSGISAGPSRLAIEVGGTPIEVYTYKPANYKDGPLIMVFHGLARNAEEYRDAARGMGDRYGALVAAPEFDLERFPFARYTRGGVLREDGTIAPREEWSWGVVPRLAEALRRAEGRPDMPYYLIGHSAGGQCVGRMAGFVETGARRLVAANAGAYLLPTRDFPFPYGFGGLPDELAGREAMQRYLAQPLTIYVGTEDTRRDDSLDTSREADLQGRTRRERGRGAYDVARRLAGRNGWEFNWRLIEARGVGHSAGGMFDNPMCGVALFGPGEGRVAPRASTSVVSRPSSPVRLLTPHGSAGTASARPFPEPKGRCVGGRPRAGRSPDLP